MLHVAVVGEACQADGRVPRGPGGCTAGTFPGVLYVALCPCPGLLGTWVLQHVAEPWTQDKTLWWEPWALTGCASGSLPWLGGEAPGVPWTSGHASEEGQGGS